MGAVWYATREALKSSLDVAETARNDVLIDRALGAASEIVEGYLHRRFYPWTGTRVFDWPQPQNRLPSWRLDLGIDEVASVSAISSGGTALDSGSWNLEPANSGPPYRSIELKRNLSASLGGGPTSQQDIAVTGVFIGCPVTEVQAGEVGTGISGSDATLTLDRGTAVGVGSILRIGTERLIVSGRSWTDSLVDTAGSLTALKNATGLVVTDATSFVPGEVIYVDAEQMLVQDVVGSALIVRRAWNGTTLAAHNTAASVYVSRSFTVSRAALGTSSASHLADAPVFLFVPPSLISALSLAEAVMYLQNEGSGWARVVGSGDNTRESAGRALKDLREQAWTAYARKVRGGAV